MIAHAYRRSLMVLAAMSVAGLLSIHGLDPVVASLDTSPHTSPTQAASPPAHHEIIGICLFIAAAAGLVFIASRRRRESAPPPPRSLTPSGRRIASGVDRRLAFRLCVLRR